MRLVGIPFVLLFAAVLPAAEPWPRLLDTRGATHSPLSDPEGKPTVFLFLGPECPISQRYTPTLKRLHKEFAGKVDFFGVVSGSSTSRAAAAKYVREFDLPFPVLFDGADELARRLKPTHVPEAFVVNADGKLAYRGRIDDWYEAPARPRAEPRQHDLKNAVIAILAGKQPDPARTQPVGCLVEELPEADAKLPSKVTYTRHVASILFAQCVDCHRPGEVAPFGLLNFADTAKRAKQILQVIRDRTMPPWQAAKDYGHFLDERRLTDAEVAMIEAWVEGGRLEGAKEDLPPLPTYQDGWQLGKPDLVVRMPEKFTVPAEGPDVYQNFVIPLNLAEDKMVGAFEFRPGNRRVVHHAVCLHDASGVARKLDDLDPAPGYSHNQYGFGFFPSGALGGWAPGSRPRWVPEGAGRFMLRGSDLVLQIHYHPSGKEETDLSEVGIYYVKKPARRPLGGFAVENWQIDIEPNTREYRRTAEYTLPVDTTFVGVGPHMHLLGREMKCWAVLKDGTQKPLIHIPRWNFNWQDEYFYRKEFKLLKGTKLFLEATFDNSEDNPFNPNRPPKKITWGEGTRDEMCMCVFEVTCDSWYDLFTLVADDVQNRNVIERFSILKRR